jgi:peptidyl-prolyl cis-trans isomerase D
MLGFFRSKGKRTQTIWWALAIVTIVTFIGGFVFILGSGLSSGFSGASVGAAGTVDGEPISREAYAAALAEQRDLYRQQYGVEPAERDYKLVELQTWRNLVSQTILKKSAERLGLRAYDPEIVLAMRTAPPQMLLAAPAFQTDGQFDPNKYAAALQDPNMNWAPFEDMLREQLPIRKLQERLLASVKLSEPELVAAFRDANERVDATIVQILPAFEQQVEVADADLDRAYEANKGRFCTPKQVQLEVLLTPKRFGEVETQAARDLANSMVQRARQGEDFAVLARDYSEGPAAENGGVVERLFLPRDFGTELEPVISALAPGQVAEPFQDGGRFMVFKLLERAPDAPSPDMASVKVAQIVIKVRPEITTLRAQYQEMHKLRDKAASAGLGRAATEAGTTTATTAFFGYNSPPQELFTAPEAADWALAAKANEVSPVFEGIDEWCVVQVKKLHEAGPMAREDVTDQLRQIAEISARVDGSKPRADQVAAALGAGQSLEQAARTIGLAPFQVREMTRRQADGRIAGIPEVMASLFAAPVGSVQGPLRGLNGWYFVQVTNRVAPPLDSLAAAKPQLTNEILQRRQQSFLGGLAVEMREGVKVQDLRNVEQRSVVMP